MIRAQPVQPALLGQQDRQVPPALRVQQVQLDQQEPQDLLVIQDQPEQLARLDQQVRQAPPALRVQQVQLDQQEPQGPLVT